MFFNKDKKIGRNLASCAIQLPEKQLQQIKEIVQNKQFSEIESRRLRLCLSILNLASIFWWVNFYEKTGQIKIDRVRKIIDVALGNFMNKFINDKATVIIGDYIVDSEEFILLGYEWGMVDITGETKTSISTLVPSIYNLRVGQYNAAFGERLKLASGENQGSLDPVAKVFVKHFAGQDSSSHAQLVVELSLLLMSYDQAIATIVGDYVAR